MGTNLLFTTFVMMVALVFIFGGDRAEPLDITKTMQGTVKEAKGNSIKIIEDSGGEAQIAVDSNTVYDNVQKLTDLRVQDKVQIEYQKNHNKNTAISIRKIEVES